ncbi:MAG TPA: hypothetical protein VG755_03665 [Nannocystaceae bacterium]|nr:hypothetical protein [Nannocystaceae bacterium]
MRPRRARSVLAIDPFAYVAGSRCPQVGRWSARMDAIRASSRIAQATLPAVLAAPRHVTSRADDSGTPAIAPVSAFAMTPAAQTERAGAQASEDERRGADDLARRRELWARDMEVRTEDATDLPDGSVRTLPTFEYEAGPDGRAYAVDGAQLWVPPQPTDDEAQPVAAPVEREDEDARSEETPREAAELEAKPAAAEPQQKEHPPPIDPRCKSYTGDRDDAPPPGARLDEFA